MEAGAGWEFTIELVDRLDHLKVAAIQLFLLLLPILIIIPLILLFRLIALLFISVYVLPLLMSSVIFFPVCCQLDWTHVLENLTMYG